MSGGICIARVPASIGSAAPALRSSSPHACSGAIVVPELESLLELAGSELELSGSMVVPFDVDIVVAGADSDPSVVPGVAGSDSSGQPSKRIDAKQADSLRTAT